jgi:hypothetical protein
MSPARNGPTSSTLAKSGRQRLPLVRAFDFTQRMRDVCQDVVARTPELAHVDLSRVAFSFCQARRRTSWGIYASLTPLRFKGGALTEVRRRRTYTIQRLFDRDGKEMLYILSFYLPRFMDLSLEEKLVTVLHELWHISPAFDGDLRRHEGRCYAHTHSQAEYDARMAVLARRWLAQNPPEPLWGFLRHSFDALLREQERVVGVRIPRPKLLPAPMGSGTA